CARESREARCSRSSCRSRRGTPRDRPAPESASPRGSKVPSCQCRWCSSKTSVVRFVVVRGEDERPQTQMDTSAGLSPKSEETAAELDRGFGESLAEVAALGLCRRELERLRVGAPRFGGAAQAAEEIGACRWEEVVVGEFAARFDFVDEVESGAWPEGH